MSVTYNDIYIALKNHSSKLDGFLAKCPDYMQSACMHGLFNVVKLLVKCGGNLKHRDRDGITPLQAACDVLSDDDSRIILIQFLLDHVDSIQTINEQDRFGNTALHFAVSNNHLAITRILLQYGADINLCNIDGDSPKTFYYHHRSHKMKKLMDKSTQEWRPWNHHTLPQSYKIAVLNLVLLAKV